MKEGEVTRLRLGKLPEAALRRDLENGGVRRSCARHEEVYLRDKAEPTTQSR